MATYCDLPEDGHNRLKFSELKPIYKKVTKRLLLVTDQFHFFLYIQKFLKKLHIKDYITI